MTPVDLSLMRFQTFSKIESDLFLIEETEHAKVSNMPWPSPVNFEVVLP